MLDNLPPLHALVVALTAIIVLILLFALVRIINGANTLEWTDLVSTIGRDGKQHADWNQIGKGLGAVLCTWLPAVYVYSPKLEAMGLAAVMGVALAYLGGVSGYAAMLRSKQGTVETTHTTEPAPDPAATKVTEKTVETPPITPRAKK